MPTETPRVFIEIDYYKAAQEAFRRLRLEDLMEATPQATQRRITLASLELVHAQRPEVQYFNELLVQYPNPRWETRKPQQVVPDNMIVVYDKPIKADGSYDVPLQPVPPFCMLEYVSKSNSRKDYDDNVEKYEQELKVPYYVLFNPSVQELTVYQHTGEKFITVLPNEYGRYAIKQLEMEVALLDGWMRFWFRGELLPLPADLLHEVQELKKVVQEKDEQLHKKDEQLHKKDEQLQQMAAELERLKQQLAQRGE